MMIAQFVGGLIIGFGLGSLYGFLVAWRQWMLGVLLAVLVLSVIGAMFTHESVGDFGAGFLTVQTVGVVIGTIIGDTVGRFVYKVCSGEITLR